MDRVDLLSRWLALFTLAIPAPGRAGEAAGARWTLEALAQRYGVAVREAGDGGFLLDGNGVRMQGVKGEDFLIVNRLKYRLEGPWEGEGATFGRADVAGLLDPLLQPAMHIEMHSQPQVCVEVVEAPEAARNVLVEKVRVMLRAVLEEYGVKVRPDGAGQPEGEFLWLRLKLAPEADARSSRCTVLARSKPEETRGGVYPGEFFDAESLILATLIQTGMVLGPGAAGKGADDAGIERIPMAELASIPGPALGVEWGEALDQEHVVKSVAAGVLRFQRFLASAKRSEGAQAAFGRRAVKLARVDLREGREAAEVEFLLSVAAKAADLAPEGRKQIEFPARFFVRDADGLIRMLAPAAARLEWGVPTLVPGDESAMATVRATVALADGESERLRAGFWGYAVWLVRQGVVEDRRATPDRLADQLWRWEGE